MGTKATSVRSSRKAVETAERLRRTIGRLGRTLRLTHEDGSLSPSQREVLSAIVRLGPLRLAELAADEGINATMLSRIVANLESAQLVTRSSDSADARVIHLSPTAAGRALYQEMRDERTDALLYAMAQLSADERRLVNDALPVLESLVESLRERRP